MGGKERATWRGNLLRKAAILRTAGAVGSAVVHALGRRREQAEKPELRLVWGATPAVRFIEDVPAARIPKAAPGAPKRLVRLSAEGHQIEKHVSEGATPAVALLGADGLWHIGRVGYGNFGKDESRGLHTVALPVNEVAPATMVLGYQEVDGPFVAVPTRVDSLCTANVMWQIHPETPHL